MSVVTFNQQIFTKHLLDTGFPASSDGKEPACNAGDPGLVLGSGRSSWRREWLPTPAFLGLPGGSDGKESTCNAGDLGSVPGSERSPGGERGNSLQCSCLENPMGKRAWWATVHEIAKSQT